MTAGQRWRHDDYRMAEAHDREITGMLEWIKTHADPVPAVASPVTQYEWRN